MNIRLLGTGAADGIPGLYSDDRVSRHARSHGGMEIRTRSAALVDGILKIDFPPDTFCQLQRDRLDTRDWTALLFTHSHEDHFSVAEIQYALYPFTELEVLPFSIYGNAKIGQKLAERYPDWPIDYVEISSFCTYEHGSYTITPIKARHDMAEECLNLMIRGRERTLLYATDTGIWEDATFLFLAEHRLDCLVIECTEGLHDNDYFGHLNLSGLSIVLERLRASGTVHTGTSILTTHHAHTGAATHCELKDALAPLGAQPGYDGLVVEF
jgi:phosphoribosyl 1,2-cyclic phosphate phosphodiesterase